MTVLGHLEQHPGLDPPDFNARIASIENDHIILDRTCFYPMGGGQPADRGRMISQSFECNVTDVRGRDEVQHRITTVEGEAEIGQSVQCEIDEMWRNQLCRMHTAQHLVSALAHETWGADTVGNQIGAERTRIDLFFQDRDEFDRDRLQNLVNETIEQDLKVTMDFRLREELLEDPLLRVNMDRMPPDIDIWRTISIGDLDVCPCAGTHVPNTAMIPAIEITRVKSKGAGRLRVEYAFNE